MQLKLELLKEGDEVLNVSENQIIVKKKSGEAEIFTIDYDENNLPRISNKTVLITFSSTKTPKATVSDDENNFEMGTF